MTIFKTKTKAVEPCIHSTPVLEFWSIETPHVSGVKDFLELFVGTQLAILPHVRILYRSASGFIVIAEKLRTWFAACRLCWYLCTIGLGFLCRLSLLFSWSIS